MAIVHILNNTVTKVNVIKDPDLTTEEKSTIIRSYAEIAVASSISDHGGIVGSSRQVSYTADTMTSLEKTNTGADKLPLVLWNRIKVDGSTYVHDGSTGKFAVVEGILYHYPATADFEDLAELISYKLPHSVLSDIGTTPEATTALGDYNTFKATLS